MTAFLRPKKPPFIRGEPGQHGDQWLMSEKNLEEYARADRAQQLELPPDLSLEQLDEKLAAWLHLNLHGYVDAKAVRSDAQRAPLTDEQIADAVREADLDWHHGWTLDETEPNRFTQLVRAIERAHGIEGGETHNARLSGRQQP